MAISPASFGTVTNTSIGLVRFLMYELISIMTANFLFPITTKYLHAAQQLHAKMHTHSQNPSVTVYREQEHTHPQCIIQST